MIDELGREIEVLQREVKQLRKAGIEALAQQNLEYNALVTACKEALIEIGCICKSRTYGTCPFCLIRHALKLPTTL